METALLTGLGLAAPAGLNAYIPLLVLALADRLTDQVSLAAPFDALSSTPAIIVLLLLLTIEIVVDKVPGADHVNDLVQTIIRPAAGAILMLAATTGFVDLSPVLMAVLGIVAAGAIHGAQATARPVMTVGTAGVFQPLGSLGEDMLATVTSVLAIFVPVLAVLGILAMGLLAFLGVRKARRALAG
ncbi:MAG: DUF4126 domain-containing protein [Chloroflexota bacterium]